jgi:hypothetical protein
MQRKEALVVAQDSKQSQAIAQKLRDYFIVQEVRSGAEAYDVLLAAPNRFAWVFAADIPDGLAEDLANFMILFNDEQQAHVKCIVVGTPPGLPHDFTPQMLEKALQG